MLLADGTHKTVMAKLFTYKTVSTCKTVKAKPRLNHVHMQDEVVQIATEMGYYAHALRLAGKEVPQTATLNPQP